MNYKTLIDSVANQADEVLDGCHNPSEAQKLVIDLLASEHPALSPADQKMVAQSVVSLLKREGFFEANSDSDAGSDDDDNDDTGAGE